MNPKIIVTLPGYDYDKATPDQCAINSDYDTLKIKLTDTQPHFGTIRVFFSVDYETANVTKRVFQIKHSYPYTPTWLFFFDKGASSANSFLSVVMGDEFDLDVFGSRRFVVSHDASNIYFDFIVDPTFSPTIPPDDLTGRTYVFRYYLFANEGI